MPILKVLSRAAVFLSLLVCASSGILSLHSEAHPRARALGVQENTPKSSAAKRSHWSDWTNSYNNPAINYRWETAAQGRVQSCRMEFRDVNLRQETRFQAIVEYTMGAPASRTAPIRIGGPTKLGYLRISACSAVYSVFAADVRRR